MTDPTSLWLLRLHALLPTEQAALLREMSRHEVEAVLLRVLNQKPKRSWWARIWGKL